MQSITLLIVNDETIYRLGLRHLLASEAGFEIKGETSSEHAVEQASILKPNIVIMSADAMRLPCAQLAASIRAAVPSAAIIALVRDADHARLGSFMAAGVLGYVLLSSKVPELLSAIRAAAEGRRSVDPRLGGELIDVLAYQATCRTKALSHREQQVLQMLAYGHTHGEIASHLGISRKSVETYRVRTREKIGVQTRADAVRYALDTGMLSSSHACDSVRLAD